MNIVKGQFHRRTGLDYAIIAVQVAICAVVIGTVAYFGVHAWIAEDTARVEKLARHIYDVALNRERATVAPAAPTGVKPNYGDLADPKTRVFQDAGERRK